MDVLHDITKVEAASDFKVRVTFDTGESGTFDCSPYLSHPYWKRLADPTFFQLVRVAYGTLVWPGDIDIAQEDVWEKTIRDSASGECRPYPQIKIPASCVAENPLPDEHRG